jgi:hypothetical protein
MRITSSYRVAAQSSFFFFAHLAWTARRALSLRSPAVMVLSRALPPLRPSFTASGLLRFPGILSF